MPFTLPLLDSRGPASFGKLIKQAIGPAGARMGVAFLSLGPHLIPATCLVTMKLLVWHSCSGHREGLRESKREHLPSGAHPKERTGLFPGKELLSNPQYSRSLDRSSCVCSHRYINRPPLVWIPFPANLPCTTQSKRTRGQDTVCGRQICKSPNPGQMLAGRVGGAGKQTVFNGGGQWPGLGQL